MVVVVSDFLAPLGPWERHLAHLTAAGHEVVLFQVLDPRERTLDFPDAVVFEDLESGQRMHLDPATARAGYQQRLAAHGEALRSLSQRLGVAFHALGTEDPLEGALFRYLQERSGSTRVQRRQPTG